MEGHIKLNPLARRLVLLTVGVSVLITVIAVLIQVVIEYRNQMQMLENRLHRIELVMIPSLEKSVWHFDEEQIKSQLQGILNVQDISYVELTVDDDTSYQVGQALPAGETMTREYPIVYTQENQEYDIGQLFVMADLNQLNSRVTGWLTKILLTVGLQTILISGLILLVVNRFLTKPLNDIVQYAENIDLDHLDQPLALVSRSVSAHKDELDVLVQKVNQMRTRLLEDMKDKKLMENALIESERSYREIFNATSEAIIVCECNSGKIIQVNQSMLRMYGYDSEKDVNGCFVTILNSDCSCYSEDEANQYIEKTLTEGHQIFEWRARKKNGELFWVEVSTRITNIGGRKCILAVIRDITERKTSEHLLVEQNEALITKQQALEEVEAELRQLNAELEKRVDERTVQLAAVNRELESFSYSIAHDLRAPLRHINGFGQILIEECGEKLGEDGNHLLQRIRQASQRMSEMVDALLELSRLSRSELVIQQVDLSRMVRDILNDLGQQEEDRDVTAEIQSGVAVHADNRLIKIMMENLLGNAWKFTAEKHPAEISFGIQSIESSLTGTVETVYFIRDNGAGFDMALAERLFTPFQRLHSTTEFSGTGIGLATVYRIIKRHGGRIWADGAVDKGATFYFTLPYTTE